MTFASRLLSLRLQMTTQVEERPTALPIGILAFARQRRSCEVLLVNDDLMCSEAIASTLRAEGHRVTIVATGGEALRRLQTQHFDLISSKYDLPGMNGEELSAWVKAVLPKQLIMIEMSDRDYYTSRSLKSSADLVLRKPFTLEEAKEAFYRLIEAKSAVTFSPATAT